ncbi:hypothetical protein T4B_15390 [Trichinella pseudospiralis]|uniref:Uncharacterized protein n=1 Tax=Trichinella pseudospiralis TaxID=6337 RepID=A0A0V1HVU6_TRIPS|nr:hypothetical protein T4B_15390 [Trichinella pseudospiralis]
MTWLQGRLFAGCWICQQRWLAVMNEQDSHLSMPSQTGGQAFRRLVFPQFCHSFAPPGRALFLSNKFTN